MKKIIIIPLLFLCSLSFAETYYVKTTGNDSADGKSDANAWLTWKKAFQTAKAGDTVYFRGGVYYVTSTSQIGAISNSGSAGNPICFYNYPGEVPILDFAGLIPPTYTWGIRAYNDKNHLNFRGLTIRNLISLTGNYLTGINIEKCTNILIENCIVHNVDCKGIGIYGCDEAYIKNCDIYDIYDHYPSEPGQIGGAIQINNDLTFGVGMYNTHVYIEGCRVWNFSDNGISPGGVGYCEIKNCWAFNGGWGYGEGCGFKMGLKSLSDTINPLTRLIHNCIAANNGNYGWSPNNRGGNTFNSHLYNNFSYHNGYKHNLLAWTPSFGNGFVILDYIGSTPAPHEMYANNLSYDNEHKEIDVSDNYTHQYNSWDQSVTVTDADFISLDLTEMLNPRKADGSLPDINFGKLASTSDLIDAGTDVGMSYNGTAPDLGWFESQPGSNMYPSIVITSPVTGSTFTAPATITVTANATDADGTISKVEFFNGATKLGEKTSNPWSFTWNNVTSGTYSLTAVATDNSGAKTTSSAVSITVNTANQPPVIAISNPVAGSTFTAPATINITANASDADGTISKVEFFNGATKLGEKTSNPWSFTWNNVPAGTYSLTAVATDNSNAKTTSSAVSITVASSTPPENQPPVITISNPVAGSTFTVPAAITITANASDSDGTISKVEFFNGATKLGEKTSNPWSFTWNNVPAGTYSLTVVATDNSGAKTTSSAVSITVNTANQPPVIAISNPVSGNTFTAPATIDITANASDADGTISKVEFFNGATKLGEKTSNPWSFTWNNVTLGTYSLTAVATDNSDAKTTSYAVSITVNNLPPVTNKPPIVSIVNPSKGRKYKKHADILIDATASDPDGTISKVEIFNGNIKLVEMTASPYSFTWKDVDTGTYSITAIATDNLNATTASSPVEVEVEDDIITSFYDVNSEILILYPNPNNGIFTIELIDPMLSEKSEIAITSYEGKVIYNGTMLQEELTKQFDLSYIIPGFYILILSRNEIVVTKKFIKE